MKKTIITLLLLFGPFSIFNLHFSIAYAEDLYIGSFYVTSTDEETLYGDDGDKWMNRRTTICDMFNFEQPDVLGLQSLTEVQLAYINQRLTNHNAAGDILYSKALELDTCGIATDMPAGSTCSWAKLRKGEKSFYVFNVCFSPETSIATTSATRVLTFIGEVNTEKLPCFVIGNIGVNETKTVYTRFSARYYDCYTKATIRSAEYGTVNNFDLAANHGTDRFDFVFAPRNATIKAYGQLQSSYFTKESDGSYKRRLPSTHFPVMAKVTLP